MITFGFILFIVVLCVPPALAFDYCGKWMKREDTRGKRKGILVIHILVALIYSVWFLFSDSEDRHLGLDDLVTGGVADFLLWLVITELHAVLFIFLAVNDIEKDKKITRT